MEKYETDNIEENKNPLATEPLGRLIGKFAVPAVISMLVSALYNIVDQIFIGQGVCYKYSISCHNNRDSDSAASGNRKCL